MSTISTPLAMAMMHASLAAATTASSAVTSATTLNGPAAFAVLLVLFAVGFLMFLARVSRQMVSLVAQFLQLAFEAGRALALVILAAGLATVVLLHL